jgi:hypothetical protein
VTVSRAIFVPAIGQYDNIGDVLLRRPLLDALRPLGPLHVYLGDAPDGYLDALELDAQDVTYRSYLRWSLALLAAASARHAHYVFKPGEIQLTVVGMKEHIGMLPALIAVRLSGGRVLRLGAGARGPGRWGGMLIRPSIALSHLTIWRDDRTGRWLRRGDVMPDLAFAATGARQPKPRTHLTVSMRGDRPEPDSAFLDVVRSLAAQRHLEISTATQVGRDDDRSAWLADHLPAASSRWDGTGHERQEAILHDLYSRSQIVVSDRLHVLIAAAIDGAIPLALLTSPSDKIDRHFRAAGLPAITVESWAPDALLLAETVIATWPGSDGMDRARERVARALDRARALLSDAPLPEGDR